MDDSYANQPVSLGEHRAVKENDARKWTPKDALASLLRQIDRGELNILNLVIVYETPHSYMNCRAVESTDKALALLHRGLHNEHLP